MGVELSADTPYLADLDAGEYLVNILHWHFLEVAHPLILRTLLGDMIGKLGQGFGGGDANTNRNTNPLPDPLPDGLACPGQILNTFEIEEAFVDAVYLLPRAEVAQNSHHPI